MQDPQTRDVYRKDKETMHHKDVQPRKRPHSLPLDSVVLANYPCHGTVAQRLLYVLRNACLAIWDVLHLSIQERYVSLSCVGLILNALAPLFIDADVYCQVFAPLISYYLRSAVVTYHLAMGPNHVPSALAMSRLFESLACFDVGGFASLMFVGRVRPSLKLAHCTAMAAGLLVLSLWHRDRVPGGIKIAWQMATRAAVPAITLYFAHGRRHGHLIRASDRSSGGGGAGASIADRTAVAKGKTAGHVPEAEAAVMGGGGGTGAAAPPWCSVGTCGSAAGNGDGGGGGGAEASSGALCAASATEGGARPAESSESALERLFEPAVADGAALGAPPCEHEAAVGATDADWSGSGGGWTTWQVSAAPAPGPLPKLPPYKAFVRRRSVRYKIPWAEPEQLGAGYEQRLCDLVAARGLHLTAVYVRRGCIELTLVIEEWREEAEEAEEVVAAEAAEGEGEGVGANRGLRTLSGAPADDAAAGAPSLPAAASGTSLTQPQLQPQPQPPSRRLRQALDLESVVRALGLLREPAADVEVDVDVESLPGDMAAEGAAAPGSGVEAARARRAAGARDGGRRSGPLEALLASVVIRELESSEDEEETSPSSHGGGRSRQRRRWRLSRRLRRWRCR
ncbi:hypothetical protein PLESTM_000408700 [Pleodorina starrii]|nr:hypothetical protein PLESTM_000408700 [Pleodorina starrii]